MNTDTPQCLQTLDSRTDALVSCCPLLDALAIIVLINEAPGREGLAGAIVLCGMTQLPGVALLLEEGPSVIMLVAATPKPSLRALRGQRAEILSDHELCLCSVNHVRQVPYVSCCFISKCHIYNLLSLC